MAETKTNLLILAAGLDIGGAEVVIKHLVHEIDRTRFNVSICCIRAPGLIGKELIQQGYDVEVLSESGLTKVEYLTFLKLRRLIRDKHIDVVHTHTTDALADAALCKLMSRRLKFVHTFHFGNYPHAASQKMRLERIFSRFATSLVAVGEVQRAQIRSTFNFRDDAIETVWNGVPFESAVPDGTFRRRVGAEDRVLIGTIATLIPQKGLADLLMVAERLRAIDRRVLFVIVGEGVLRAELEARRDELGLADTVLLPGWIKDASRVALPEFDIFFQPSRWEAMSIAVLEAMAAGRAIVATRVGENRHMLSDGVEGLLAEPGNVDEMTAALARLVEDVGFRQRLGTAAARKVAERFTVEQMARAYERIYLR
jgi:glycosyltransferase involved in cell wall biosynthesis